MYFVTPNFFKEACEVIINSLATDTIDIPFAMLYTYDNGTLRLAGQTGLSEHFLPDTFTTNETYDNAIVSGIIKATSSRIFNQKNK